VPHDPVDIDDQGLFTKVPPAILGLTVPLDPVDINDQGLFTRVPPAILGLTVPLDPVDINDQGLFTVDVAFSDPAGVYDEPYTCEFDMDNDGANVVTVSGVTGTACSTALNYSVPGVYTVRATVTDKDGGFDSELAAACIVIYDPEGGYVTGGGWIWSPEGACRFQGCETGTTGKANFGFVSKYKKGADVPTGNTEFQFKAGNLNFHSDSYEWLVIAGGNAKYKGVGTINGSGEYGFMLTATDADLTPSTNVDLFRIKIWDTLNGDAVVYDNKMDVDDNSYGGTAIGGGNIKVHKAKGE
jgi:hypothetical protein